jgi:hypothetical protein
MARFLPDDPWFQLLAIVFVSASSVALNTDPRADPRFDGSGYAVLGESLATGRGYREIDHPDRPRHAHFPPGYPVMLAGLWTMTGRSVIAAHVLSWLATTSAAVGTWWWFRSLYRPRVAVVLGLALSVNWTWGRIGGEIQSEPLFLLLQSFVLLLGLHLRRDGRARGGAALGAVIGACVLTRHVGLCLGLALGVDLLLCGRRAALFGMVAAVVLTILPWVIWVIAVRRNPQAGLLIQVGLVERVASQALFYVRRIPDQVVGPIVEVGTVFRNSPILAAAMTAWAFLATGVVVLGWVRALRSPRRRVLGLVPIVTLALLLLWPFTEAGRFLIPLLPFVLSGTVEGLAAAFACCGRSPGTPRGSAALVVLAISLPYAAYAIAAGRSEALRRTHREYDNACAWIRQNATQPGPLLTQHPGEAYCRTGRQALAPPSNDSEEIDRVVDRYRVAYLLVDEVRYANAPPNPVGLYAKRHPERARVIWTSSGPGRAASVIEIKPSHRRAAPSMRARPGGPRRVQSARGSGRNRGWDRFSESFSKWTATELPTEKREDSPRAVLPFHETVGAVFARETAQYISSYPPCPPPAAGFSSLGMSAIRASEVSRSVATLAAFCKAERVTLVGSMMPSATRSVYLSLRAS